MASNQTNEAQGLSVQSINEARWSLSDTQYLRIRRRLQPEDRAVRALIIRVSGLVARVELPSCSWCAAYNGPICSACGEKGDRARASLARTAAKRAARKAAA